MKPLAHTIKANALLSRQLQDEDSNSIDQRVDALIKKRDLMNCSKNLHLIAIMCRLHMTMSRPCR